MNFKTYQKVRTIIRFSSKFTILPFLFLQTICHLFTIMYYGTSLHRSHVISHTLKLNHITPNVSYTHAYKGFVPILIYQNKQSWQKLIRKYRLLYSVYLAMKNKYSMVFGSFFVTNRRCIFNEHLLGFSTKYYLDMGPCVNIFL